MASVPSLAVFTGCRSEFGRLDPVCRLLRDSSDFNLKVIAGVAHYLPEFGETWREIEAAGYTIDFSMRPDSTSPGTLDVLRETQSFICDYFDRHEFDALILLGDRFELLSVTAAALVKTLPIIHIGGGQVTEGAFDNQIRFMVSKAASLHYVANQHFADVLRQTFEEDWRVSIVGSTSIDAVVGVADPGRDKVAADTGLDLSQPTALVALHPPTLDEDDTGSLVDAFFAALMELDIQCVISYPNSDPGHEQVIEAIRNYEKNAPKPCVVRQNFGLDLWINLIRHCSFMIGNSSSGIIESTAANTPVVDVGSRQRGRLAGDNVVRCGFDKASIVSAAHQALKYDKEQCDQPYGDGKAAARICADIKDKLSQYSRHQLVTKAAGKAGKP